MVNLGMSDFAHFTTFDNSTVTPSSLPSPMSPTYIAGEPMDTIAMINPTPEPTNSTIYMAEESKSAEWKKPSYNYSRVKAAEDTTMNPFTILGLGFLGFGVFGVIRMLGESFDESGLNIGGNPTP